MDGVYKWDVNGTKTEFPVGSSASDFSDSVFATIEKVSFDSISVDKSTKTVMVKNFKAIKGVHNVAQIVFGAIPGWTYVFDCNYLDYQQTGDDNSAWLYLVCKGDCTIKLPDNAVLSGSFHNSANSKITLINTLAEFTKMDLSTTKGFKAVDDLVVKFSHNATEIGAEETVNNQTYEVQSADTVAFSGTIDKSGTITIPEEVEINGKTYKVTTIAKGAFDGNTSLKSLVIPSSVTKIEKYACADCKNLKNITLNADTLKAIDKHAFDGIKKKAKFKILAKKKTAYNKCVKKIKKSTDVKNIKTQMVKSKK